MDEQTFDGQPVAEEAIEQPAEVTPEGQEQQVTEQAQAQEPAWKKAGYKDPDQMYSELRKHQSEADRLKLENQRLKVPAQQQQPQMTQEQVIEEFVKDPHGFIAKQVQAQTAPVVAKAELMAYAQAGHPEVLDPVFKSRMSELSDTNPAIAMMPNGMDMLYYTVKHEFDSVTTTQAQTQVTAARQQAETVKRNEAFVESSTQPKRTATPLIKPGMSIEESSKALDAMGIGYVPEDRYSER
jgi:hypothetical protein